jgi:hypothetical protein
MKIRKLEEQPMKLHTKKGPRLRIRQKSRARPGRMKLHRVKKTPLSRLKQRAESSNASIQVKKQQLYTLGRATLKQLDGGKELSESMDVAATLATPLTVTASKGEKNSNFKKKSANSNGEKGGQASGTAGAKATRSRMIWHCFP